ncbi:MAG: CapA family protein [Treponema sp.]|nr:CapA family protein [Treponema sp.]
MKNKITAAYYVIIFLSILSCTAGNQQSFDNTLSDISESARVENIMIIGKGDPWREYTLSLAAVGDNLYHDSLIRNSYRNGAYDFAHVYTEVKDIIKNADLAFINQETVMAGSGFGYSGYPLFNTPQRLAYNLVDAGFDIMNLANNHAMDMGRNGLHSTLDFLDTIKELTVIGARKEGESARIITKNNISLGFLSYTFSLNGIPLPRDEPNLVSMINRDKMAQEIRDLRPLCDFLIVSMHWGAEYLLQPDREQISLANFLAEQNVDLVLGHHPHVLQRSEKLRRPDGKETLVFYSLGNFASQQRERERIIGVISFVNFKKTVSAEDDIEGNPVLDLSITDYAFMPVITHYDRNFANTKIYPLNSYSRELLVNHGYLIHDDNSLTMDFFYNVLNRLNTPIIMENPYKDKILRRQIYYSREMPNINDFYSVK